MHMLLDHVSARQANFNITAKECILSVKARRIHQMYAGQHVIVNAKWFSVFLSLSLSRNMKLTLIDVAGCYNNSDSQGYQGLHSIILFFRFVWFCFMKLTLIEVASCHNNSDS